MALTGSIDRTSLAAASASSFFQGRSLRRSLPAAFVFPMRKNLVVWSRKLSGLEEAMRIRRARELQGASNLRKKAPLRRGKVSKSLVVPEGIPKPPYVGMNLPEISSEHQLHDDEGIVHMKAACELAARVLDFAGTLVRPSITTDEIDKEVHKMIINAGAYPSPLGYGGFPKSVCTSVNECMCHGIPDSRQLQDGDIINIDVTVYLNGYHGDTSKTFFCGDVDEPTKRLVKVTEECLEKAISICKDGVSFKKIGTKISEHAEKYGFGVVERFVGHGVGKVFHSEPLILHNHPRKNIKVQHSTNIIGSQELELEDVQRGRDCAMCLCEEMPVVFLPCAHQVVCKQCNV